MAGAIFDSAHWTSRTLDVLFPLYAAIEVLARQQVMDQAMLDPSDVDEAAEMAAEAELRSRMEFLASDMTKTTYGQLAGTLSLGSTAGENMDQLASRVTHVFDGAREVRAPMIAHTEVVGASTAPATSSPFTCRSISGPRPIAGTRCTTAERVRPTAPPAARKSRCTSPSRLEGSQRCTPATVRSPPRESIGCRCYATYSPARVPDSAMLVTTGGSQSTLDTIKPSTATPSALDSSRTSTRASEKSRSCSRTTPSTNSKTVFLPRDLHPRFQGRPPDHVLDARPARTDGSRYQRPEPPRGQRDRRRLQRLPLPRRGARRVPGAPRPPGVQPAQEQGTVTDFSFGFMRNGPVVPWRNQRGVWAFTSAHMYEFSPVAVGAIPGAKSFSLRDGIETEEETGMTIDEILQLRAAGLDDVEFREMLKLALPEGYRETIRISTPAAAVERAPADPGIRAAGNIVGPGDGHEVKGVDLLAQATDAALDRAIQLFGAVDTSDLDPNIRQAIDLVHAAGVSIDELLEQAGIDDPDDGDDDYDGERTAKIQAPGDLDPDTIEIRATLTAEDRTALSDDDFGYIEPGAKKGVSKTPEHGYHFPIGESRTCVTPSHASPAGHSSGPRPRARSKHTLARWASTSASGPSLSTWRLSSGWRHARRRVGRDAAASGRSGGHLRQASGDSRGLASPFVTPHLERRTRMILVATTVPPFVMDQEDTWASWIRTGEELRANSPEPVHFFAGHRD